MTKPPDNSRRPARPTRRFSALRPPTGRPAVPPATDDDPVPAAPVEAQAAPKSFKPVPTKPEGPKPEQVRLEPTTTEAAADEARIAKVLARAGLCSRREAESWILAGRVAVNGAPIESPALNVAPSDQITVDGYPIDKPDHTRLFMFHKTRGLVTTAKDPEGRPTIYDALPDALPRLITIGRLDINTEGLLLLTNDGGLARLLELPSTGWIRRYRVRANGHIDQSQLDALAKGVTVEGIDYAGIDAKLDRIQGANLWMTLGLREGKNREVKRVLEHLGLSVNRLIRISFGPFQLGDLAENAVEEVKTRVLRDQLGTALARQAGVDLDRHDEPPPRESLPREPRRQQPSRAGDGAQTKPARAAGAPRPHVSVLRAARTETEDGPRRKTQRASTADRKGRAVAIERISTVRPAREETGPARSEWSPRPDAARPDRSEGRVRTIRQADARPRRADGEERPARTSADDGRRAQRSARPFGDRPSRGDRPAEGARPSRATGDRPPRDAARPFRDGAPRSAAVRDDRSGPKRGPKPEGRREDRGGGDRSSRPGGKPGFKGGGGGKAPGAGGRGRPRG